MSIEIGQQLRQARLARSLSLEQAAQATRMRLRYLEAMEAGQFDSLPSVVQARGFLRAYAEFLHLDPEPLLRELNGKELEPQPPATAGPPERKTGPIPAPAARGPAPASVEKPAADPESVQPIFEEIGFRLQQQRELLGLSIEDVERHTHLRRHYLRALEAGNLAGLPSPVQGRGMLNNYASFLGLDPEPLLLRFAEGLQARLAASQPSRPESRPAATRRPWKLPGPFRRLFSTDILIGGAFSLFLVGFMLWGAVRIFTMRGSGESPAATAPSIADVLLSIPTATPSPTPEPRSSPQPLPTAAPVLFEPAEVITGSNVTTGTAGTVAGGAGAGGTKGQINVQVSITVNQRAWMRVTVDGKIEFEGRVLAGGAYAFGGSTQVEVLTSNGAALQVLFNQQDLGLMGQFGQVVDRVYTPQGVLGPTPTSSPTSAPATKTAITPTPSRWTPAPTGTRPASPPAIP